VIRIPQVVIEIKDPRVESVMNFLRDLGRDVGVPKTMVIGGCQKIDVLMLLNTLFDGKGGMEESCLPWFFNSFKGGKDSAQCNTVVFDYVLKGLVAAEVFTEKLSEAKVYQLCKQDNENSDLVHYLNHGFNADRVYIKEMDDALALREVYQQHYTCEGEGIIYIKECDVDDPAGKILYHPENL
jgi:hypothetical protein